MPARPTQVILHPLLIRRIRLAVPTIPALNRVPMIMMVATIPRPHRLRPRRQISSVSVSSFSQTA
ncbi:MAG: hypothetical protein DI579_03965 [Lawsonella clevelandensis]|uniref:Uncharacterized protein n=1 Tax=Lawsonella clevelandensis TaxID=1528099 RepID=A0A2W5IFB6_9ACTN|nr:MAG: hypothetical protein DI579_03965 [Lawsonella clevelandensis]